MIISSCWKPISFKGGIIYDEKIFYCDVNINDFDIYLIYTVMGY